MLGGPETSDHAMGMYYVYVMNHIQQWMRPQDVVTVHWYWGAPSLQNYIGAASSHSFGHQIWLTETGTATCDDSYQASVYSSILGTFEMTPYNWTRIFFYVLQNDTPCSERIVDSNWNNRPAFDFYKWWISEYQ